MERTINWTTAGYATQLPSGDKEYTLPVRVKIHNIPLLQDTSKL